MTLADTIQTHIDRATADKARVQADAAVAVNELDAKIAKLQIAHAFAVANPDIEPRTIDLTQFGVVTLHTA